MSSDDDECHAAATVGSDRRTRRGARNRRQGPKFRSLPPKIALQSLHDGSSAGDPEEGEEAEEHDEGQEEEQEEEQEEKQDEEQDEEQDENQDEEQEESPLPPPPELPVELSAEDELSSLPPDLEEPPAAWANVPDPETSQPSPRHSDAASPGLTVAAKSRSLARARGRSRGAGAKGFTQSSGVAQVLSNSRMQRGPRLGVAGPELQPDAALSAAQAHVVETPMISLQEHNIDAAQDGPLTGGPEASSQVRPSTGAEHAMDENIQSSASTPRRGRSRRDRQRRRKDEGFKPIDGRPGKTEEPVDVELPEGEEELPTEELPKPLPQLEPKPPVEELPVDPADDGRWPGPRHVHIRITGPAAWRQGWFVEHPGEVEIHGLLLSRISVPLKVMGTTAGGQDFWEQQQHILAGDLLVGIDNSNVSQGEVGHVVAQLRKSPRLLTFCRSIVNHLRVVREQLGAPCGPGVPVAAVWAQPTRDVLPPQPVPEGWRAVGVRAKRPLDLRLEVPSAGLPPVVVEIVGPRAGFWSDHGVVTGDFLVKANGVALSGHSLGHAHSMLEKRPLQLLFQSQNSFYKDLGYFGLSEPKNNLYNGLGNYGLGGVVDGNATAAPLPQYQREHHLHAQQHLQRQPQQQQQPQLQQQQQHEQQQTQQHHPISVLHQVSAAYAASFDKPMKVQAEVNAKIFDEQARCREKAMQIAWEAHNDVRRQREGLLLKEQEEAQNRVVALLDHNVSATPQHLTNLATAAARTKQLETAARGALESVVRRRFEDALRGASETVEAASLGSGVNEAMRILEEQKLGATW